MTTYQDTATIILVDDEEMVLTSLSSFLTLETDYEVHTIHLCKRSPGLC
jgi:DNA-binding NarL/FixJ family response regulator